MRNQLLFTPGLSWTRVEHPGLLVNRNRKLTISISDHCLSLAPSLITGEDSWSSRHFPQGQAETRVQYLPRSPTPHLQLSLPWLLKYVCKREASQVCREPGEGEGCVCATSCYFLAVPFSTLPPLVLKIGGSW